MLEQSKDILFEWVLLANGSSKPKTRAFLRHLCVIDRAKALELEAYTDSESYGRQP